MTTVAEATVTATTTAATEVAVVMTTDAHQSTVTSLVMIAMAETDVVEATAEATIAHHVVHQEKAAATVAAATRLHHAMPHHEAMAEKSAAVTIKRHDKVMVLPGATNEQSAVTQAPISARNFKRAVNTQGVLAGVRQTVLLLHLVPFVRCDFSMCY